MDHYKKSSRQAERILQSHLNQVESKNILERIFQPDQFIERDKLSAEKIANAQLVISLGGDNHAAYVAHLCRKTPILLLNSDIQHSIGALTQASAIKFQEQLHDLVQGTYKLQLWPRILVSANGKPVGSGMNEVAFAEKTFYDMSRLVVTHGEKVFSTKGSGLLLVTGGGSTGWYRSASRDYFNSQGNYKGDIFPKGTNEIHYFVREPYGTDEEVAATTRHGIIYPGQEVTIQSLCDTYGIAAIDAVSECEFKLDIGQNVTIGFDPQPLNVVSF